MGTCVVVVMLFTTLLLEAFGEQYQLAVGVSGPPARGMADGPLQWSCRAGAGQLPQNGVPLHEAGLGPALAEAPGVACVGERQETDDNSTHDGVVHDPA